MYSLTVYTASKMHEKFAFQKIRMKPTHMIMKSYAESSTSNRLNFIM